MPTNEELMDALVRVERQVANVLVRLEANTEQRFEAMDIQLKWYQMILFKVVVPLVIGILVLLSVKESNVGLVIANFMAP